jgi:uncharacterized protein YkwD
MPDSGRRVTGVFSLMWLGRLAAACVVCIAGAAVPAAAQTPYEAQVLAALNAARTDPAAYAQGLRQYRTYIHGKMIEMPGANVQIETSEGAAVVDETIAFLGHQAALAPVAAATLLEGSAADHVVDQGRTGQTGHAGSDGSSPSVRAERRGGGAYVAEVIAYGPIDATDAVRQLIVDDGVADRGHRSIIFSAELRYAGVSCGPHPEFRTMCVIDLGITPDARMPQRLASR